MSKLHTYLVADNKVEMEIQSVKFIFLSDIFSGYRSLLTTLIDTGTFDNMLFGDNSYTLIGPRELIDTLEDLDYEDSNVDSILKRLRLIEEQKNLYVDMEN